MQSFNSFGCIIYILAIQTNRLLKFLLWILLDTNMIIIDNTYHYQLTYYNNLLTDMKCWIQYIKINADLEVNKNITAISSHAAFVRKRKTILTLKQCMIFNFHKNNYNGLY